MKKIILTVLIVLITIMLHAEKVSDLPELTVPRLMDIHEGKLYVTDDATVYVYNLSDGKPERSFGKKGHGPGEFAPNAQWDSHLNIQVFDRGVFLHTMHKMGWLNFDGQPLSEKKIPFFCTAISPLGNLFVTKRYEQMNGKHYYSIITVNDSLEKTAVLDQIEYKYNGTFQPIQNPIQFQVFQDKIYLINGARGTIIFVFSPGGKIIEKIPFQTEKTRINHPIRQQIREWLNSKGWYRQIPAQSREKMVFPKYLPPFLQFIIKDTNMYIHTFDHQKEETRFISVSLDSKQSREIFLPLANRSLFDPAPYSFHQDAYYVLTENKNTEIWELHRVNITP